MASVVTPEDSWKRRTKATVMRQMTEMSEAERQKALNETFTAVTSEKLDEQTCFGFVSVFTSSIIFLILFCSSCKVTVHCKNAC